MNSVYARPATITRPFGLNELTARPLSMDEALGLADMSRGIGAQARSFLADIPSSSDPEPTFMASLAVAKEARGRLFLVGAFSGRPDGTERLVGLTVGNTFEQQAVVFGERDTYTFGMLHLIAVARDVRRRGVAGAMLDSAYNGFELAGLHAHEPRRYGRDLSAGTLRQIAEQLGISLIR